MLLVFMVVRIAVANQKGGVGKTTTAVNLAACLATSGKRVILVDLDPQGNASTSLGVPADVGQDGSYALFSDSGQSKAPQPTRVANLSLLAAGMNLAGVDVELARDDNRAFRLRDALSHARFLDADILVIDCPPSFGILTVNALAAANAVLVPLQCEFFALEGLAHLTRTIDAVRSSYNSSLTMLGILLTMYDRRNNLSELVAADVRSFFGDAVLESVIPRNIKLTEAPSHGLPILLYDPRSPGSLAYERLAVEIQDRISARLPKHA